MRLASFNILSNRSSNFALAGKRKETPEEYQERYDLIIDKLEDLMKTGVELICLQEVTPEFGEMMREYLKEHDKIQYWFVTVPNVYRQAVLVNIEKCSHRQIPNPIHRKFKHHKIQTLVIHQHYPEVAFYLVNVHLSGEQGDVGEAGRREALQEAVKFLQEYSTTKKPFLIVGDFNSNLEELVTAKLQNFLNDNQLQFYEKNKLITSYHKYDYTFNQTTSELTYAGVTKKPYETVDQLIFTPSRFKVKSLKLNPPKGLDGLEVPYTHQEVKNEVINLRNYDTWPSDHALLIYDLEVTLVGSHPVRLFVKPKKGKAKTASKTRSKTSKARSKAKSSKTSRN